MSYTVLARKYRPQTFGELVGQEHVARTLSNAISADRVAHAFLFTGVRGVGKTTSARLLAKALNCEKGPAPEPCNTCEICESITAGLDVDVQEIDGASNNSVDDVRRLQESLPYRPQRDRFKIVIVDEVHMLSTGAFNAFLKTLEEPPAHVKFIFATTESHKVPITIRSRCQRYDFRLIPQAVIADRVKTILGDEGITADDETVALVAREAAGSMRDALTLLDQLVAFGGDSLLGEEVARTLGIAGRTNVHGAARACLEGDAAAVLRAVDALATQGVDMLHFARQLLGLLRDLVVLRVAGSEQDLVDLVAEERDQARALAESIDSLELQRAFAAVAKLVDEVAHAASPRTVLEMGLVRVATRPPLRGVAELIARLEAIDKRGGGGGGGRGGAPSPSRGAGPGRAGGSAARTASAQAPAPAPAAPAPAPAATPSPKPATAAASVGSAAAPPETPAAAPVSPTSTPPAPTAPPNEPPTPDPTRRMRAVPKMATGAPSFDGAPMPTSEDAAASAAFEPAPVEQPETAPKAADSDGLRRPALQEWERLIGKLRDVNGMLAAVLANGLPRLVTKERIVVSFRDGSFHGRQADQPAAREALVAVAAELLGGTPEIEVRFDADTAGKDNTVAAIESKREEAKLEQKRREARNHPRVVEALAVFPDAANKVEVHIDRD